MQPFFIFQQKSAYLTKSKLNLWVENNMEYIYRGEKVDPVRFLSLPKIGLFGSVTFLNYTYKLSKQTLLTLIQDENMLTNFGLFETHSFTNSMYL